MKTWESTIEEVIGYTFKNKELLRQAFTRRSFTQENGGQNNEILEFVGDKVLDVTVVKILTDSFGEINDDGEFQTINGESEGKLTQIKASLVERKSLAFRMKMLDLARFLRMGKGDILNHSCINAINFFWIYRLSLCRIIKFWNKRKKITLF